MLPKKAAPVYPPVSFLGVAELHCYLYFLGALTHQSRFVGKTIYLLLYIQLVVAKMEAKLLRSPNSPVFYEELKLAIYLKFINLNPNPNPEA